MISLKGSLRDCKAYQEWAAKLQSDRFENPDSMICPVWSGRDLLGRPVSEDSFYTKLEGCNTPLDRVAVENALRPQYMEQVTTDAYGFRANLYQRPPHPSAATTTPPSTMSPYKHCPFYPYDMHSPQDAVYADYSRHAQTIQHLAKAQEFQKLAGFA